MARRTSPKTAAANRRFAKTQPLRTYQTKGGAQQYGSAEDFERHANLGFDRFMKRMRGVNADSIDGTGDTLRDLKKLSAIYHSLDAGVASAPRSYGGQLSEELEKIGMEAARDRFRRGKFKGTF